MTNDIRTNIIKTFESLERIEKVAKTTFSVYGPVVPFLLLGTLQTAINRQIGCPEHSSELLNISNGLRKPIPVLKLKDTEPIIACVSKEVGDTSESLKNLFQTSLFVFDSISNDFNETRLPIDGFYDLNFDKDAKEIFETAILLSDKMIYMGRGITNPSIALLARDILSVQPGEIFSDFVCGLGLSSSLIAGDVSNVKMCLTDEDSISYAFACICCFFNNVQNCGKNEDSLSASHFSDGVKSDKFFLDPPLRVKMESSFDVNEIKIKESSCSAIMKVAHQLKDGGKAVIAINTGFAYGTQFDMDAIRKYLIDCGLVSAVISLPSMWTISGSLTSLLVLSKMENKEIAMIDLARKSNDTKLFDYSREVQANILTKEGINCIISMLSGDNDIPGVCSKVDYEKVVSSKYSLLPSAYLEEKRENKLSVNEIDAKIKETVSELQALMAQL